KGPRLGHADVDVSPEIERLVRSRRAVAVGQVAAPAAVDPAGHDHGLGDFAEKVPDTLAERPQQLLLGAAQDALGKDQNATTGAEDRRSLAQLRGLAAENSPGDANSPHDVYHQPVDEGQIVKVAGHHRRDLARDDL